MEFRLLNRRSTRRNRYSMMQYLNSKPEMMSKNSSNAKSNPVSAPEPMKQRVIKAPVSAPEPLKHRVIKA